MSSWKPNARSDFLAETWPQSAVAVAAANDVVHQLNSVEKEAPPMHTYVGAQDKKRIINRRRYRCKWLDLTGSSYVAMREEAALELAGLDPPDASTVAQGAKTEQLLSTPELLNLDVNPKETSTAMSSWEPNARRVFLAESCLQSAIAVAVANDVVHQLNSDEEEAPPMRTDVRVEEKKRSFNRRRNRGNGLDLTWTGYVAMREEAALQLAGLDPPDASTVAQGAKTEQLLSSPELQNLEADAKETFTAMSSWELNARRDFFRRILPAERSRRRSGQ
jgi:hypothetical protein